MHSKRLIQEVPLSCPRDEVPRAWGVSKGSSRNRMHIIACIAKIQPPITYWLKCDVKRFWGASDGSSLITGCTAPRHNGIDIQNKD